MASIALGAVGSLLGGPIGGAIGSALGSLIDQAIINKATRKKPSLIDLQVQSATYGLIKPRPYGRARLSGSLIASTKLTPELHKGGKTGGKGGSSAGKGSAQPYYTYSATFAVGICEGPINNIWRIFADSKVIWDMDPNSSAGGNNPQPLPQSGFLGGTLGGIAAFYQFGQGKNSNTQSVIGSAQFYYGTEAQGPDPTLQGLFGASNVPAFRGLAYVVFIGFPLKYFGNRIPNLSFEVNGSFSGGATGASNFFTGAALPSGAGQLLYDVGHNIVFDLASSHLDIINGGTAGIIQSVTFASDAIASSLGSPSFNSTISGQEIGPDGNAYLEIAAGGSNALLIVNPYTGPRRIVGVPANTGTGLGNLNGAGVVAWLGTTGYLFLGDSTGLFQIYNSAMQVAFVGWITNGNQQVWQYQYPVDTTATPAVAPVKIYTGSAATTYNSPTSIVWAEHRSQLVLLDGAHGVQFVLDLSSGLPVIETAAALSGFNATGPYRVQYDNTTDNFLYQSQSDLYAVSNLATLAAVAHTDANTQSGGAASTWYSWTDYFSNQVLVGAISVTAGTKAILLSTADLSLAPGPGGAPNPYDWTSPPAGAVNAFTHAPSVAAKGVPAAGQPMLYSPYAGGGIQYASIDGRTPGWGSYNFGAAAVLVKDVVAAEIEQCGIGSSQYDLTALTDQLYGTIVSTEQSARTTIEGLQEIFLFDLVESNGKLTARYRLASAQSPSATISADDLGARALPAGTSPGANPVPAITEKRKQDLDLPAKLVLRYKTIRGDMYVKDFSMQPAAQYAKRARAAVGTVHSVSLNSVVVLDDQTAANLALQALYLQYAQRSTVEFSVPAKYLGIEAGDVVYLNFPDRQGNTVTYTIHVQQVDIGADNTLKIMAMTTSALSFAAAAHFQTSIVTAQPLPAISPTTVQLMDLPPLRDQDDDVGIYYGMCGIGQSLYWSAALLRSVDGGVSYANLGATTIPAVIGQARTVLPSAPAAPWDTTNSVTVNLTAGSLTGVTPVQVLNGANIFLLGDEICGASKAVHNPDGTYTLSLLRRGLFGTDTAIGGHAIGERFVVLANDGSTLNFDMATGDIGAAELYIGATAGQSLDSMTPQSFTATGRRIKPDPVAHASIAYDGSNNATISWVPRRRIGFEWIDGVERGVDEPTEDYSIDILNGMGAVVRTITSWSVVTGTVGSTAGADTGRRTAAYSAAQQTTDGFTPGGPVTCSIYQLSSRIGRGIARTITQ